MLSSEFLSYYEKVPSLPVPELQSTLDKYLRYLKAMYLYSLTKQSDNNFEK